MQSALMVMTTRPGHLLSQRTGAITSIRMVFNLPDRGPMKALVVTAVIRPGEKFNGSLALTIEQVALVGFLMNRHFQLPFHRVIL